MSQDEEAAVDLVQTLNDIVSHSEKKIYVFVGDGSNGKTTLVNLLSEFIYMEAVWPQRLQPKFLNSVLVIRGGSDDNDIKALEEEFSQVSNKSLIYVTNHPVSFNNVPYKTVTATFGEHDNFVATKETERELKKLFIS